MNTREYWQQPVFNLVFQDSVIIRGGSFGLCKAKQKELERIEFYKKFKNYFKIAKNN